MPLPSYLPCVSSDGGKRREHLVADYHGQGCTNNEILAFLAVHHGIVICVSTLKRILVKLGLKRKYPTGSENLEEIRKEIALELEGSTSVLGYRKVWHILRLKGVIVKRKTVMELLREMDPEGVIQRKKRKLKRRIYTVPGPDFMWHLDGYDKLKPFGFSIHGCIDGYSRRLLWLEVSSSNKKPEVIAHFYVQTVKQLGGIPTRIRSDDGVEVSIIEPMQITMRSEHTDEFAGEASFCVGTSPANQKIECYWSQLTKERPLWWRNFFSDLSSHGFIDGSNHLVIECLRFCFMHLIRDELTDVAIRWNQHLLAPSRHSILPRGRPDSLYFLPELNGTISYRKDIDTDVINEFDDEAFSFFCVDNDKDFVEFAEEVLVLKGLDTKPKTVPSALKTYFVLLEAIDFYS